jgi:hypothetical protein
VSECALTSNVRSSPLSDLNNSLRRSSGEALKEESVGEESVGEESVRALKVSVERRVLSTANEWRP